MAGTDWFYVENGVRVGPVTREQICALFAGGRLGLGTQVWCAQFKDWNEASKIAAFRELARSAPPLPPPLPPFAPVVAPPPTTLPPLKMQGDGAAVVPFASPVGAPQPVFIAGLGGFAGGGATPEETSAATARLYPAAPPTSGPPLMTPHAHAGDPANAPAYDADGHPIADPSHARPWVRFFARAIDATLWAMVTVVLMALLRIENVLFKWAMASAWFFVEAALLSACGTTMGKSLLGVRVRSADGAHLSFGAALARALVVWVKGQGCNLPVLNLVMHAVSYNQLKTFGVTSWDEQAKLRVRHEPLGAGRWLAAAAVVILAVGIGMAVGVQQALEQQRAETRAQAGAHAAGRPAWADARDGE